MRFRLHILVLCLCLLGATAAEARVTWIVNGRGFGHGVGMSQYGAYGFALHGKSHQFILSHYYRGTSLGTLSSRQVVRVLVDVSGGDVGFSGASSACGVRLDPGRRYGAHRAGDRVRLRGPGGRQLANCGGGLRAAGAGTIGIEGTVYRGALEVVPTSSNPGSLNAINAVPIDQYVKGVIPNESPASWPLAALRAQAIAARSYALTGKVDGNGFDLYEDTRSQVYEGVASEDPRTNRAADETRGVVVRYGGAIAQTFFSACSGGHTESVQNVFFGPPVPYLVGVPDPYDRLCPLHTWTLRFSGPEISSKLDAYLAGKLKRIVVTKRGASPRIVQARLYGTGGISTIRGDQLAAALGGYDRWMHFVKLVDGKVVGRSGNPPGGAQTPP
ncbi:MAG TPA: SpoIID/LytB domain-containing protein [Solirubrobacterales bacterium]|jgi:stage II sporulation protein D